MGQTVPETSADAPTIRWLRSSTRSEGPLLLGPSEGWGVWGPSAGRGRGATGELSSLHIRAQLCSSLVPGRPRKGVDGYSF